MALDGITISNVIYELNDRLLGGRIDKIYQPQTDEIIFSVRSIGANFKMLLSANTSHPRIHITNIQKENPASPPLFCMVLRKYVAGGKITAIKQPDFERIIILKVESMNEMGDITTKNIIIEIMGKHSNIILTDENNKILDSIKHISHDKSSVREVLPGKQYVFPPSQGKKNPLTLNKKEFIENASLNAGTKIQEYIYKSYTGISPIMASELCFRAGIETSLHCSEMNSDMLEKLYIYFESMTEDIKHNKFMPEIVYEPKTNKIIDFSVFEMNLFSGFKKVKFESVSQLLESFYAQRDNTYHIQQKSHDMKRLVISNIERCVKKKEIQIKTIKDTEGKDTWKLKGELLTSNIYAVKKGENIFKTINFYDENMPEINISIETTLTPSENAQKYFNKYNKAKRTLAALEIQIKQNNSELEYLEGVLNSIENSSDEADLEEIKEELCEQGYIRKKHIKNKKQQKIKKSKPIHFISSDGFHIYVGKSNIQNDELTMHTASPKDIWLHTKNIPGSHVIIKTEENENISDKTILEAAVLAAYNSKAKNSSNVPVDYTARKNVKKPNGAKPGMVIYEQYKTVYITPDETSVNNIEKID